MKEPEVLSFTKAELNHTDRPSISLYEQPSITFEEYKYGLFMYEGNLCMKVSNGLFYNTSGEDMSIKPNDEIYPLIPDYSQLAKNTLNKYAKVIEKGGEILGDI